MDENRYREYLSLIQELLRCPTGQEETILADNSGLQDAGLAEIIRQMESYLTAQAELVKVEFLLKLAQIIEQPESNSNLTVEDEAINSPESVKQIITAFEKFILAKNPTELQQILKAHPELLSEEADGVIQQLITITQQQKNEQAEHIYSEHYQLIARCRELGIEKGFAPKKGSSGGGMPSVLSTIIQELYKPASIAEMPRRVQLCQQALSFIPREQNSYLWAVLQGELGNSCSQNPLGNQAENMEKAIKAYKKALEVFTPTDMPMEWSSAMLTLANAYINRIRGERAENVEKAIKACNQALEITDRKNMTVQWAGAMNNLANAYRVRIRGEKAENIEEAIIAYKQVLEVRTRTAMPVEWADTMNNLAAAYSNRIRGKRAENLEEAIKAYKQVLEIFTKTTMPVKWATTMMNLGSAYGERIKGEKVKNIEKTITYYKQALEIFTQTTMPMEWARIMSGLGTAYSIRIKGKIADNIEQAIASHKQALKLITKTNLPLEWARTMVSLGSVYLKRIRGDKAENIEKAIASHKKALEVTTKFKLPLEWARTMVSLGNAYLERIRGERLENIEQAIITYKQVLEVLTKNAMPMEWAGTMINLANAYSVRIRGERAENIELTIAACKQVLELFTKDAMPLDWATTLNNLAIAYLKRIRGDKAKNIEEAIIACQQALEVETRTAMPVKWAGTMSNLGIAYSYRTIGGKAENIEQAIAIYEQVLEVETKTAMPVKWAKTMGNLGSAYRSRIRGERAKNIEEAITAYKQALEIFHPQTLPFECRQAARSLGNLYGEENRWAEANKYYKTALEAFEVLYEASLSLMGKEEELEETGDLYHRTAYALTHSGNLREAVVTLEKGRARNLSETLARDRADLERVKILAPKVYESYQEAANLLQNLEAQERMRTTEQVNKEITITPEGIRQQGLQARQQLNDTIEQIRQLDGYENFLASPTFNDISQAIEVAQPLIYLTATEYGTIVLVINRTSSNDTSVDSIELNDFTDAQLEELLFGDEGASEFEGWFGAYKNHRKNPQAWLNTIDRVTNELWSKLMEPVVSYLQKKKIQQAILIPTGLLGLIPLHAAWTEDLEKPCGRRYALDEITFTYAPNACSLLTARKISTNTSPDTLLAVDNPSKNLPNSEREVQTAIETFSNHRIFKQEQATKQAVKNALSDYSVLHFSCHGYGCSKL